MQNWKSLKDEIYFKDGSLRDIYVLNTTRQDWKSLSELVNRNFEVSFYNGRPHQPSDKIDIEEIFSFWSNPTDYSDYFSATIQLGPVQIKCYFFQETEIENDIDPREVTSEEDHLKISEYLNAVAKILNKEVILTSENMETDILLKVTP